MGENSTLYVAWYTNTLMRGGRIVLSYDGLYRVARVWREPCALKVEQYGKGEQ